MKLRSSVLLALRFLFPLAKGSVSNARKSLFGAMSCVGLSLIPLVVVLVVSSGMIQGITSRIIGLSSYDIQAVYDDTANAKITLSAIETYSAQIRECVGVEQTFIERQGLALAAGKTARSGVTVRAVQSDIFTRNTAFAELFTVHSGTLAFSSPQSVLIGKKLAQVIGVTAGDTIRLITLRERNHALVPRLNSFTVSGVISSGYQELDALWVFMPLQTGFELLSGANSKLLIGVQTSDAFSVKLTELAGTIEKKVASNKFGIFTWRELNESQYENFESTRVMLLFIMMLIVLTASVNVSSALVMLVMERRKEIAILKSFGATQQGITAIFVCAGMCTGIGGVLVGIPLGLLCALNINEIIIFIEKTLNFLLQSVYILKGTVSATQAVHLLDPAYYLETIPIIIPFFELFIIAAGTIVLSAAVSFIPALRSGKEKPLAILRKF